MSFYVPLPLDTIPLGAPIPINVWEADGTLLLRKGEVIETERHRINLMAHSPVVLESDFKAWTYSYTTQLDRMVRRNESINKLAEATRPTELSTAEQPDNMDPVTAWPDLQAALANGDTQELERLDGLINAEVERLNLVRGDVGSRLQALDRVGNRLADETVLLQEALSGEFDTDLAAAVTRVAQIQATLEAVLKIAAQTSQLSLLSFL